MAGPRVEWRVELLAVVQKKGVNFSAENYRMVTVTASVCESPIQKPS